MEQRLDLLAQHRHPLEMAQHTQRDEVGHIQNTAYAEALAYPRQGALHGREQFGQHGLVGEALHQCMKAIRNHGGLRYAAVLQQKIAAP